jgi:hypothetical protein
MKRDRETELRETEKQRREIETQNDDRQRNRMTRDR